MDLSKKVFGANVKKDIRGYIEDLQKGDFEIKPSESIKPKTESYLGDRTPYIRMWTAVSVGSVTREKNEDTNKWEWKSSGTTKQTIYSINENRQESYSELDSIGKATSDFSYNPDLQKNPYLKPPAGIKSVNSKSEGAVGALRRTSVEFVVHNKNDFETIYLPFFLKPGATVFVDFGWSDESLNLYIPEKKLENQADISMQNFYKDLYKDDGTIGSGFKTTLSGQVTKYDVNVDQNGSFNCTLEFVSSNYSLLDKEVSEDSELKFIFNNSIEELIMGYFLQVSGESISIPELTNLAKNSNLTDEQRSKLVKQFFDSDISNDQPGQITGTPLQIGIFYQDIAMLESDVLNDQESLYISYGLFEDLFLNNFVSEWQTTAIKDGVEVIVHTEKSKESFSPTFSSINSYVRWDENLNLLQSQKFRNSDKSMSFLYPSSWNLHGQNNVSKQDVLTDPEYLEKSRKVGGDASAYLTMMEFLQSGRGAVTIPEEDKDSSSDDLIFDNSESKTGSMTYNKTRPLGFFSKDNPDGWYSTEEDKKKRRIPLRELFISVPTISEAFSKAKNVNDALELIFDAIYDDSGGIINIKMIPNNSAQASITFQDIHVEADKFGNEDELMLTFDVTSGNSVVQNFDFKFETPKAGLSSMIAIGNLKWPQVFRGDQLMRFNLMNAIFSEDENVQVKHLPVMGDIPRRKKSLSMRLDSLLTSGQKNVTGFFSQAVYKDPGSRYTTYKTSLQEIDSSSKAPPKKPIKTEDLPSEDGEGIPIFWATSDRNAYLLRAKVENFMKSTENSISPIMPVTLSLKVYGSNFLGIGDFFTVNYLPQHYKDRVFFQIVGIDHAIDTTGWSTNYTTVMRLKSKETYKHAGPKDPPPATIKLHPEEEDKQKEETNDPLPDNFKNEVTNKLINELTTKDRKILDNLPEDADSPYAKIYIDVQNGTFHDLVGDKKIEIEKAIEETKGFWTNTTAVSDRMAMGVNLPARFTPGQFAYWITISELILGDKLIDWKKLSDNYISPWGTNPELAPKLENYRSYIATNVSSRNKPYVTPRLKNGKLNSYFDDFVLEYFNQPTTEDAWNLTWGLDKFQTKLHDWIINRFEGTMSHLPDGKTVSDHLPKDIHNGNPTDEKSFHFFHAIFWNAEHTAEEGEYDFKKITLDGSTDFEVMPTFIVPTKYLIPPNDVSVKQVFNLWKYKYIKVFEHLKDVMVDDINWMNHLEALKKKYGEETEEGKTLRTIYHSNF